MSKFASTKCDNVVCNCEMQTEPAAFGMSLDALNQTDWYNVHSGNEAYDFCCIECLSMWVTQKLKINKPVK